MLVDTLIIQYLLISMPAFKFSHPNLRYEPLAATPTSMARNFGILTYKPEVKFPRPLIPSTPPLPLTPGFDFSLYDKLNV